MLHRKILVIAFVWIVVACTPNNVALGPNELDAVGDEENKIEVEAARDGVFVLQGGQSQPLSLSELVALEIGQSIAVDEDGRAIARFGDALSVELLQDAEIQLPQLIVDEEAAALTLIQNGGIVIADLTMQSNAETQLTIQTAFGTIVATGGRFVIVHELNNPMAWVLGLEGSEGEVLVTAGSVTTSIVGGQGRWLTPVGEAGPPVEVSRGVEAWLNGVRNSVEQPSLSEILLAPANLVGDTRNITTLPPPGEPFEFGNDIQGTISLTLDPKGIFGRPAYWLEDCNSDGIQDIAVQDGILALDFRQLIARVQAVTVTVLNRDRPGQGLLEVLDSARTEIGQQQLQAAAGETQTLSLRSEQFYHYAELAVSDACFLALSLTPPGETSQPIAPQPVTQSQQDDVVVNVLATPESTGSLPQNNQLQDSQLQAPAVSTGDFAGLIEIDGAQSDWDSLSQQSGVDWMAISAITYNAACANRYPDSGSLSDLNARVQLAYDDQYLYAAFVVNDDGVVTYTGGDERYFLGDSPQLLLDLDLNGDFGATQLSGDDVQIDLLPNINAPLAALWQLNTLASSQLIDVLLAVTPTDTGYFVEVGIPWQRLNTTPLPGSRLGIVASISDNDTPDSNIQECIISTSPQHDWRNPATWGTVLLLPVSGG